MIPRAPLKAGERYSFRVKAGLPFRDGGVLEADRSSRFTVARPAVMQLPKQLLLKVMVPRPGPTLPTQLLEVPLNLEIIGQDANGLMARLEIGGGRQQILHLYQDAERIRLQAFALPLAGPGGVSSLADASSVVGNLVLNTENSVSPKLAQGTMTIGAPGVKLPNVAWTLEDAGAIRSVH
jgi:hypothetical protein